jgi:hypothetical protein
MYNKVATRSLCRTITHENIFSENHGPARLMYGLVNTAVAVVAPLLPMKWSFGCCYGVLSGGLFVPGMVAVPQF